MEFLLEHSEESGFVAEEGGWTEGTDGALHFEDSLSALTFAAANHLHEARLAIRFS